MFHINLLLKFAKNGEILMLNQVPTLLTPLDCVGFNATLSSAGFSFSEILKLLDCKDWTLFVFDVSDTGTDIRVVVPAEWTGFNNIPLMGNILFPAETTTWLLPLNEFIKMLLVFKTDSVSILFTLTIVDSGFAFGDNGSSFILLSQGAAIVSSSVFHPVKKE